MVVFKRKPVAAPGSNKTAAECNRDNQQECTGKKLYRFHRYFMQKMLAKNDPGKRGKRTAQDQGPLIRTDRLPN